MDLIGFRDYCLSFEGVEEKTPFGKFARRYDSVLVFYVMGHMFCFVDMDDFTYVNVRLTPDEVGSLQERYVSWGAPLNCSQKYWIRLDFGGDISDSLIKENIARAYMVVKDLYTKKRKNSNNGSEL